MANNNQPLCIAGVALLQMQCWCIFSHCKKMQNNENNMLLGVASEGGNLVCGNWWHHPQMQCFDQKQTKNMQSVVLQVSIKRK